MVVALCVAIVVGGVGIVMTVPVQAYVWTISTYINPDFELSVNPNIAVQSIPRYQLGLTTVTGQRLSWSLNISQIRFDLNVSAANLENQIFFNFTFTFDSLADQIVHITRGYDAALKSQNFTLAIDAVLFVRFGDQPDILKEFHFSRQMTFPI